MKLLSPVGNMDALRAAVYHGADEVYLGVGGYNARNNIDGFTLDTLPEAVDFAHLYGVRVCLTVNILFADDELQGACDLVVSAYNMGVDAFIVQDLGLAALLHAHAPDVPLHASTQMGLHNLEGVQAVLPFGFRRVVLSRETPLAEIERIRRNTDVEIEYFAQGALCVCFSGNCYLSERLCDASGNRGRCKQLCRLPYTLELDGKAIKKGYLLSAKDFNMLSRLPRLQAAGVDVLKIEGRARRPSYVAMTTAVYREALDGGHPDPELLTLAFNRLFTAGYYDGNADIISPYNNHIGVAVGTVRRVVGGKRFNEVYFSSDRSIAPRSALKFYVDGAEESTVSAFDLAEVDGLYRLTTTQPVSVGAEVRLITDAKVEAEVLAHARRVPARLTLSVRVGEPLCATFELNGQTHSVYGAVAAEALNQPLSLEELQANFDKNPYFEPTLQTEAMDNVFLPKRALNEWRRDVWTAYREAVLAPYRHDLATFAVSESPTMPRVDDFAVVRTHESLPDSPVVVYSPETYRAEDVRAFAEACRAAGRRPYLDAPVFALSEDVALLRRIVEATGVGVVANNYYALSLTGDVLAGGGLNVYNKHTAQALGVPVVDTRMPYMTLLHCPMQSHVGGDCAHCVYREGYHYVMDNGKVLTLTRKRMSACTFYLE